jgi:aminopeptidase-like protein
LDVLRPDPSDRDCASTVAHAPDADVTASPVAEGGLGERMYALVEALYPICRSITGNGVRQSLALIGKHIPIKVTEVSSGTKVFDWVVPREWNITDAYIANASGERVHEFRDSNLHVLNYSVPVRKVLPLETLRSHIYTLPDQPDLVPYRTSYYEERWGFCMSQRALDAMPPGDYTAVVESTLEDGSLTYGEYVLPGEGDDEVLLSAHICHPSLANDNCSGLALLTLLAQELAQRRRRYTYRFLFAPGTIGAITWLALNEKRVGRIKHGLVISCVGDGGAPTYKKSRRGNALIDRAMVHVLKHDTASPVVRDFSPYGYDERQYCSPGFNLPVGLFQRSEHGTFPEYHTSADGLGLIAPEHLEHSYRLLRTAIDILEHDRLMINRQPKCEPALGARGLYATVGGDKNAAQSNMAMLWVLNFSDGEHSLLDIAERADLPFATIWQAAERLRAAALLREQEPARD